jgi:transposase-like protein
MTRDSRAVSTTSLVTVVIWLISRMRSICAARRLVRRKLLSRSLQNLITLVAGLRRSGVGFRSLHEALDTTPGGRLVFHVFAALAEFIRELIVEGTREGLDAARARGQRLGRPPAMTGEQIRQARDLLSLPGNSISSIARLLGVSRSTIYKHLPELADGRNRAAGQIPPSRPGLPARLAITAPPAARPDAGSGDNATPAAPRTAALRTPSSSSSTRPTGSRPRAWSSCATTTTAARWA